MDTKPRHHTKLWIVLGIFLLLIIAYWLFYSHQISQSKKASGSSDHTVTLTNVSYDPTRELYAAYDKAFQTYWQKKTGKKVNIDVSNGGSGKQANSVIEGNKADVVTLAVASDITSIQKAGLINAGWQKEFSDNSAPYTSAIVFLVRKGNPKHIQDWSDLIRSGVKIITPNPKTSGGARWNYLSAWAFADKKYHHSQTADKAFLKKLYHNVTVLDSGARDATTTFVQNGQGDVLLAWENEALLAMKEHPGKYQIVTPSISMKAEPPVAIVNKVAKQRGTTKIAKAYINYLYSKKAQEIEAQNFYRPTNKQVAKKYKHQFPTIKRVSINDPIFGGWNKVQKKHFDNGGIFDQIYQK
ncbi:sulfate ABC transporter substrate-binding protein [Lentilactobacillus hilgardii]|jgi:sulfate transport system substrate-binding protein|uniref:Sulfate ABC transporter substrate-binding protein n=1 Tax=Lentilactobacillus hilgardii TaxID=1588 RepID=A0A6P1E0V2_LENHI|nr:sulfate ABC transporter substrate-binding protein [Lentilactobacillus hilgardii]EEI72487.1 sulfate ABC transporter, sulfate-binding protein [Lentilactobacillus hilgardii ATCC 27305]MCT3392203.1 sulfate ABC transporter substrate-binding protein [Lentilactobacillus hilgardii]QHB50767.1 sulfate ABC transporter substrate-binding protein [Lentilactobacillus hilgardii]RRG11564.1 MAG: sulfate ABC transporter substrate-binding protein [Lactobacillus sp.]